MGDEIPAICAWLSYEYRPYRYWRFGLSYSYYDQARADRVAREYGDNWLSRYLAKKNLPTSWLVFYLFEQAWQFNLR